jgi:hypothetical protein
MNISRYTEWYEQPANDPYKGNYANLFRSFDPSVTPIDATGKDILASIATSSDSMTAFLMLTAEGRVQVVHHIRTCSRFWGEAESPHHRVATAMLGDIAASGPRFVEIPPSAFAFTDEFKNVLTPAAIQSAIQAFPDAHQLAVDPHAPDVLAVRSRFYMLVPPSLTGRVLKTSMSEGGLTPRELWIHFAGPLLDDDRLGRDCAPFIDWCRLAYAHGIGADNPLCQELPLVLPMNSILCPFRLDILNQDIPLWEADLKMEGVEHTVVRERGISVLPLSVDVDAKSVFFGETKIVLPISPDIEYLNEMKERVQQSGLVTRKIVCLMQH